MADTLTITLAQLNPTVGDIQGNIDKILSLYHAYKDTANLIVFSEMIITGYPVEDLVLKPFFIDQVIQQTEKLAAEIKDGAALLISAPWKENDKIYNSALLLHDGKIQDIRHKHHLPNYGVFDEMRIFEPGPLPEPVDFKGTKLGIMTCEDMWHPDVAAHLKQQGAEIFVTANGSPFEIGKNHIRIEHAKNRANENSLPLIYVNQIGGQDELVFDGASFVVNKDGNITTQLPSHEEYVTKTLWEKEDNAWVCKSFETQQDIADDLGSIYQTLVLGLRDYVDKNGFSGVLLGMSGGVDSALCATIATDALGPDRVRTYMMPSPYTSQESLDDAEECCTLLGIKHETVSITPAIKAYDAILSDAKTENTGITAENIQARSRGLFLMAVSNSTGYMVLSTGNKSEVSVGYATLYGDMCGGFNPLKDVYKTTVFALCHWRNQNKPKNAKGPEGRVIPERIITKPPSAELRLDQKDEDSLPPYDKLDDILHSLVEEELNLDAIVVKGHAPETVNKVWKLLDRAEYKRRQACPGVKISSKAFGRDRRYPIVNKFQSIIEE